MALKFAYSESEQVLRSVGDRPNGLVGYVSHPDRGATVVVSPKADVGTYRGDHRAMVAEHEETFIDDDEAVEACADGVAATCLWNLCSNLLVHMARHELPRGNIEQFRAALDAAEILLDKLLARFAA